MGFLLPVWCAKSVCFDRWLMDHNKPDKALKVLAQLHAHGNEQDPWVMAEYEQIQSSIAFEHDNEAKSYLELFRSRSSFRRLFLCCALQASVQMTGVSAIQYYSVTIYGKHNINRIECQRGILTLFNRPNWHLWKRHSQVSNAPFKASAWLLTTL